MGFPLPLAISASALLSIATAASAQSQQQPDARRPPNVVLILADDLGTLDLGCYGSHDLHTPHIDGLADSGVRFTQAYAHTVCCPARAALLTGRHPQRSGIVNWTQGDLKAKPGINLPLAEETLAEAFRAAGYKTALFGKWHLGAHADHGPTKQGFDEFFGLRGGFIDNYTHHFLHGRGFHDLYDGTTPVTARGEYFPTMQIERALAFLDANAAAPFFLYLPLNVPHYPEQPLAEVRERCAGIEDPARRSYAAVVATTDLLVGRVLDRLDALDVRDDTIVVFLSDNGHSEETGLKIRFDDHSSGLAQGTEYGASGGGRTGRWIGRKGTFFEGGIRVPAILNYPGALPQGVVRDQIVTAMDWFPTLLELCGIERGEAAPTLDGHSVLPLARSETAASGHGGVLHFGWRDQWVVREGDWKLIGGHKREPALYSLADRRPETIDHAADRPEVVARLRALHERWLDDVRPK